MESRAPRTGEADRGRGAPSRSGGTPARIPAIAIVLLAGLALRLIIAYVLFPGSGFKTDLGSFTAWALTLAHDGPGQFYASAGFADYPPGYLYVLWAIGQIANALSGLFGGGAVTVAGITMGKPAFIAGALLKLPAIAADIGIGYLLYRIVRHWRGERPDARAAGLAAAALFLFNPVTWYDSALWGQVDSVGALVMLVAVILLIDGFSEGAVAATVVAGLIKPQFGLVLAPIVGVLLLRRHLFAIGSGPRATLVPARLRAWAAEEQGPWRLVSSAVVGAAVLLVLIVPFALDLPTLLKRMGDTAGGYPYLSVNAYNPWALVSSAGRDSLAAGGGWSPDDVPFLGSIRGVTIGAIALVGAFLVGVVQVAWRDSCRSILLAVIFLSLAFFILPTRVHERYLYPVFAFLPLLAVGQRSFRIATLALALGSFVNLHGVLTLPLYGTPNVVGLPLGKDFRDFWWVATSVVIQAAVFVYVTWRLRPAADLVVRPIRGLLGYPARPPDDDPLGAPTLGPAPPRPLAEPLGEAPNALALRGASPAAVVSSDAAHLDLAPAGGTGWTERLLGTLPPWLMRRSLRRDRSAELRTESPGRPDRLDLVLVCLVIVAAMTLRTWRLEEPYGMHFDEVYHARTATEFLQDWRYGEPHSIYEFTHPHLAKYLIAGGLVLFGDDRVTAQASLGAPVSATVIEPRWSPDDRPSERDGDRIYAATPDGLRIYDLASRQPVASIALGDGSSPARLALDPSSHTLYVSDGAGGIWTLDTPLLDVLRRDRAAAPPAPTRLGTLGAAPSQVVVSSNGAMLIAILPGDRLVSVSTTDAHQLASVSSGGAAALAIVDGRGAAGQVAVADAQGLSLRDPATLAVQGTVALQGHATGMVLMRGLDQPTIYVASGRRISWVTVPASGSPVPAGSLDMPGPVRDVTWDDASNLIHVLGRTPDGTSDTIYVVEPHANAVFADARLPFAATSWALDTQRDRPSLDRQQLLAVGAAGQLAVVDIGQHAYAWRIVGVIAGALMAGLLYLLGRILFRRRSVALLAATLGLLDGMLFEQSRIAMNDTYVALFIVAGYTLFAALYLDVWKGRVAALLGLPAVGVLLGLALASKWVGAYAIGGVILLLLLRSALGRVLVLAAMVGLTGVLGWIAIGSTSASAPLGDATFLVIMVVLTSLLAAALVLRPARWTPEEVRFAVAAPAALGGAFGLIAITVGSRLESGLFGIAALAPRNLALQGAVLVAVALLIYGLFMFAGRRGWGPLARPDPSTNGAADPAARPTDPPRQAWLLPGAGWGLPWLLALACLTILPLVIYVVSYIPWVGLGNQFWSGFPPGHSGQTLWDLTLSMYNYHNDLRAAHAASSPWWAWPFDLKPVWFFQQGYADGTTGIIYDAGNLVLFWVGLPVMAWAAWQGWARRRPALLLIAAGYACQWLSWSRIDRATFQYHYFTAVPFLVLAVAYFLAELWHGPSARTWLVARVIAAATIVAVPLMWLLRAPLCWFAGTSRVVTNSQVCGYVSLPFVLTQRVAVSGLILAVGATLVVWQLRILTREERQQRRHGGAPRVSAPEAAWLFVTVAATLGALVLTQGRFGDQPIVSVPIGSAGPYVVALFALGALAVIAYVVLQARDPRRFAVGLLGAMALWFVLFYPDIGALPIPTGLKNAFQVLPLPTYAYDFQFAVNTDPARQIRVLGPESAALTLVTAALAAAVMYAAWSWRVTRAEARAGPSDLARPGPRTGEADATVG